MDMKVVTGNAKRFLISATLLSAILLSTNANSKEVGESYIYDKSVVKSLLQPSISKTEKSKVTRKVEEIIKHYSQKDNYLAHKLLFTIYSEDKSDFYSLRSAEEQLERMGTVSHGSYSKYVIDYYADKNSPFYNPKRAERIATVCAEQGVEKCLVIMFNAALHDKSFEEALTTSMKESFYRLAKEGFKTNKAKYTYARAAGTGILPNKGLQEKLLIEAAEDLHIPSLETVAGLYAEQFYKDTSKTKTFYYTYLTMIVKSDLSRTAMARLGDATSGVPLEAIEKTMKLANEKLISRGYKIPDQFAQP